jgi:Tfp pilus assembly protein PilZ
MTNHERRRYVRITLMLDVWVGSEGVYTRNDERISMLGVGGAFIETNTYFPLKSTLVMRFRLYENEDFITCHAVVRNYEGGKGIGVEFTDLSKEERTRIRKFIETHLLSEALQQTASNAESRDARQMTDAQQAQNLRAALTSA